MTKKSNIKKRTFRHVRPAKIQTSLRIRVVLSESLLGAFWIAKDAKMNVMMTDFYPAAKDLSVFLVFFFFFFLFFFLFFFVFFFFCFFVCFFFSFFFFFFFLFKQN